MIGKIVIVIVFVGLVLAFGVWPRFANKMLLSETFINSIASAFNLKKKSERLFVGKKSGYFLEMLFILPSSNHLMNNPRIRISLNYKVEREIKRQESKIEELRTKYPEFKWVANCIFTDIEVQKNYPTENDVKVRIDKMESILQKEDLVGTTETESDKYTEDWDNEMLE